MADLERLEDFITENFRIKEGETAVDAAIRLLERLKELTPGRETEETSTVEKGKHGRIHQIYETRYRDTEELISKREEATSYYPTGEINIIIQKWFNAEGKLLKMRTIKYFIDGRQPKVIEVKDNEL